MARSSNDAAPANSPPEPPNDGASGGDQKIELTAVEYLAKGKLLLRNSTFDEAIDCFSQAVQCKIDDCGVEENDGILAPYYLWYGDALLCQAENQKSLFNITEKQSEQEGVSNEQLAFEILEMARIAYECKIGLTCDVLKLEGNVSGSAVATAAACVAAPVPTIIDFSFVHMRLGDILLLGEHPAEAAQDYLRAKLLRQLHPQIGREQTMQCILSYAQALMYASHPDKALEQFKDVATILDAIAAKNLSLPPGVTDKDIEESREDIRVQMSELSQNATNTTTVKEAIRSAMNSNLSLDTPTLSDDVPVHTIISNPIDHENSNNENLQTTTGTDAAETSESQQPAKRARVATETDTSLSAA